LRDGYVHAGGAHRELRSFPTRRSSDLRRALGRIPAKRDGRRDIEIGELLKDPVKAGDAVVLSDKIGLAGFLIAHAHARDMDEDRSEEHTSELQSRENLVCRLLLEKKKY